MVWYCPWDFDIGRGAAETYIKIPWTISNHPRPILFIFYCFWVMACAISNLLHEIYFRIWSVISKIWYCASAISKSDIALVQYHPLCNIIPQCNIEILSLCLGNKYKYTFFSIFTIKILFRSIIYIEKKYKKIHF